MRIIILILCLSLQGCAAPLAIISAASMAAQGIWLAIDRPAYGDSEK